MSPIFNHHALNRLSTRDLILLRETLRLCLCHKNLSEAERNNLYAALANIDTALRCRFNPLAPRTPAPSP